MTTATATATATKPRAADRVDLAVELRTSGMVLWRELLRFGRQKTRIVGGLVQPILFLFVLGYGLGSLIGST